MDDGDAEADYSVLEGEPRFRLLRRPHLGVSAARNAGLDEAKGEVVLFADPDDGLGPGWMESLAKAVEGVDFAWGGFTLESGGKTVLMESPDAGRVYRGEEVKNRVWRAVFGYRLRDALSHPSRNGLWKACGREFGTVWCRAFRRNVLADLRFDEGLALNEDAIFLAEYAVRAKSMRVVGDTSYVYRIRREGAANVESLERKAANKFALRDARSRIDPAKRFWRGTYLLSAVELLREAGLKTAWRYLTSRGI